MFLLLKVSDADPNTATSVAPAAILKRDFKKTPCRISLAHTYLSPGFIQHKNKHVTSADVYGLQLRGWIGNYILQHRGSLGCLVSEQDTAHEGLCGFLGVHRCGLPSTWRDDLWCLKKGFYHLAAQRDSKHIHYISWYEVLDMFKHCKKTIVKFMTEHEMATIYYEIKKNASLQHVWAHSCVRGKGFFFLLFLSRCACSAERKTNKSLGTLGFAQGERYYLRYPLWRDKAGGLDRWQARSWKHVYQLDFHPCRDNFLGSSENETHTFWTWCPPKKKWCVQCSDFSSI